MSASAADHRRAAKSAAQTDRRAANDRGLILLRALAAGHAGTALRIGTPAEILEARGLLHALGYTQAGDGRWERPEDRRALQIGQLLRDGKGEEARALLPGSAGASRSRARGPARSARERERAAAPSARARRASRRRPT